MAVSQSLLDQLMKLDERDRLEVARLLVSSVDDVDDLDEHERAQLHASLVRSADDIKQGRTHDARAVLDELRLRHRP